MKTYNSPQEVLTATIRALKLSDFDSKFLANAMQTYATFVAMEQNAALQERLSVNGGEL